MFIYRVVFGITVILTAILIAPVYAGDHGANASDTNCSGLITADVVYLDEVKLEVDHQNFSRIYVYFFDSQARRFVGISVKEYIARKFADKKILCIVPVEQHASGHGSGPALQIYYTER
ncbi:MAG: hypothetical protein HYW90_01745 [Candidatus Sungbacteria bacterium]|nr:hypothetical protein [Candidatus Sungbacteria bacterium]